MASHMNCPECEHPFGFSSALLGKTVRCRQCQHTFTVQAPAPTEAKTPVPATVDLPVLQPLPKTSETTKATSTTPPPLPAKVGNERDAVRRTRDREKQEQRPDVRDERRPASRRSRADDERPRTRTNRYAEDGERDDRPATPRRGQPGSDRGMLLGMLVGSGLLLALLVAVVGYILWPSGSKSTNNDEQLVLNTDPNQNPPFNPVLVNPPVVKLPPIVNPPVNPPPRDDNIPKLDDVVNQRPKNKLPAVKPDVPGVVVNNALSNRKEIALGGQAESVVAGANGKLLCFSVPTTKKVVIVDLAQGKIVKELPVGANALFAAGRNTLYVLNGDNMERWNLTTFTRESSSRFPFATETKAMAMGSDTEGPLVVAVKEENNPQSLAQLRYLDAKTYADLKYRVQGQSNAFGLGLFDKPVSIHASNDGKVVTTFALGSLSGLQCDVIDGTNVSRTWQHTLGDPLVPLSDGRALCGRGHLYDFSLKATGKQVGDFFNPTWFIPAVEGDAYVALTLARERRFGQRQQPLLFDIYHGNGAPTLNMGELPDFQWAVSGPRPETFHGNVFFSLRAKTLALLAPANKDRLVTYQLRLD
jgi:hypothetical protein